MRVLGNAAPRCDMTRRTAFAVVAALTALGLAGALFLWFKPRPQAKPSDIELFPQSSLVMTNRGPYVCPIRGLVEGMPPLPPPDVDPACHRQSKAEAHAEAERKRLLA